MSGRIAVIGRGVVGDRVVGRLALVDHVDLVERVTTVEQIAADEVDLAVLAMSGPHAVAAAALVEREVHVVSVGDDVADVRAMLELDDVATSAGVSLVVGAGMAPGLSELLARHIALSLHTVDEIHIAAHGTAGPGCARQHHRRLAGRAVGWYDGEWIRRPAGSGRELCFFPEPVGAYDCYRAEMASPILLHDGFPDAARISARVSANRRDRFTAWLPMLTPPHREGGVGALRVEVRGRAADGSRAALIVGLAEQTATATAATALALADGVVHGAVPSGAIHAADPRLDVVSLLRSVERLGVRLQEFTGVPNLAIRPAA